ncbi:SDR family NAD(P)-dependent oxidoreductase [Pandoraea nosoerga]|uniref:3-oxoacyl-ACP reductase n=1 Tax=Pandoraea nosoerga TaxID=2508296 RepID=A0A5E4RE73_9BURK|nr:SDR family NAD(P)-dependent oxidoreductase [Pandoraea nosoerga]MBN4666725.1 SDR family NAD(P)-dependent oxidoreductase [Pandoraea nosoerga]MBN4676873.1 SDR family NAD(P)-dependent oxidoreductase [Pandoraea nosoerga]MBN4681520.1 SDR family NAD(P)-dependent oxidoreductase [Pandoraea nosoerga]MBN4745992.1 SDR family NAD(P)-dependent oxidoreductase [Pandoraea nosoerga]VVD60794.1 3-oxoacyl-ACP reductase [Pandoraea nosoerga]
MTPNAGRVPTILLIGASRGLGHAMAEEFLRRGWHVVGTVRRHKPATPLHALAGEYPGRVEIEVLDITMSGQLEALAGRLTDRVFDILFVNAGTTNPDPTQTIGEVSTSDFVELMVTNALSPMRVIERLAKHVLPDGLIGVMSSGQGSIANNETGQRELYRGTKAALNQFMRSFAARETDTPRAMVAMAPGWVRTALGGPQGRLSIEESIPNVVDVLLAKRGRPGLEYLDYLGRTVPW